MKTFAPALVLCALALAGCSGASGLSTSSLFGGSKTDVAAPAPAPPSDPTGRAFQVATVSARAVKCGYNFDPAKLKSAFLAAETTRGGPGADIGRVEKIYDISYNGVMKAVTGQTDYCTSAKTKEIKEDLTRHLAGDYEPSQKKVVAAPSEGLFSGWGSGSSDDKGVNSTLPTANPY
jgi:hypothetical protein